MGLEPGATLLVEEREGFLILKPKPTDYVNRFRCLHREVWEGIDPVEYVRREREAWTEER